MEEKTMEQIRNTEDLGPQQSVPSDLIGRRVAHPVFGTGNVIGIPRDGQGLIIQFDTIVTPRTFSDASKISFL